MRCVEAARVISRKKIVIAAKVGFDDFLLLKKFHKAYRQK